MSMLEKMARRLATDALERVKPGTYTNVVDEIWLYGTEDGGKYKVSDHPGNGSEDAPVLDSTDACERMVAMMAEQAGAIVVVPEDAPMDSHLAQIAQLLVDSADMPTEEEDVPNGAAIVRAVKAALDWLAETLIDKRRLESTTRLQEIIGERDRFREQFYTAQQENGALTAKLETSQRDTKRNVIEAANWQARYETMSEALSMALDRLAGVSK